MEKTYSQLTVNIYEQLNIKLTVMIPTQHTLLKLATKNTNIRGFEQRLCVSMILYCHYGICNGKLQALGGIP